MLVLSRMRDEKIVIDLSGVSPADLAALASGKAVIAVEVIDVRSCGKVRLGLHAPYTVQMDREEVWKEKRREGAKPKAVTPPAPKPDGYVARQSVSRGPVAPTAK